MLPTILALTSVAHAGDVGLGLGLGDPSGITLKVYFSDTTALDVMVGEMWEGWKEDDLMFSVDFLVEPATLAQGGDAQLDFYIGGGANAWTSGRSFLAVEMPIGLSLMFRKVPVEIFLEAVPMVVIVENQDFMAGGTLGARYYF